MSQRSSVHRRACTHTHAHTHTYTKTYHKAHDYTQLSASCFSVALFPQQTKPIQGTRACTKTKKTPPPTTTTLHEHKLGRKITKWGLMWQYERFLLQYKASKSILNINLDIHVTLLSNIQEKFEFRPSSFIPHTAEVCARQVNILCG